MNDFFKNYPCIILGCNVLASAVAINLKKSGFPVIMVARESEIVLRRKLSFRDTLLAGRKTINNVTGIAVSEDIYHCAKPEDSLYHQKLLDQVDLLQKHSAFPVLSLIEFTLYKQYRYPDIFIHTMTNVKEEPDLDMGKLVISLHPEAVPGVNCHLFVESSLSGDFGEFYWKSKPELKSAGKVCQDKIHQLQAEHEGVFITERGIGEIIEQRSRIGKIDIHEVRSPVAGKIIGLRHSGEIIGQADPIAEIDTNTKSINDSMFSFQDRYLSMAVLQAILFSIRNNKI